jgi:hypothetical protein
MGGAPLGGVVSCTICADFRDIKPLRSVQECAPFSTCQIVTKAPLVAFGQEADGRAGRSIVSYGSGSVACLGISILPIQCRQRIRWMDNDDREHEILMYSCKAGVRWDWEETSRKVVVNWSQIILYS